MGSGYQRSDEDEELNNWLKVAAISDKVGKNAEESDIATSYSALSKGQSVPEGMSDRVKLGARKMLADSMEGATIEAEQQIMNDINLKAKETGVAPHNYLRDNIDSYLTSPQNFRAVGKISKMMQERQYADAVYQKSKMEEGKLRYDEAASLVSAAEGLYAKGDITGSKKMIATLSKILPIPGHVALNEETGDLEAYATDLDGGGAKKTGDKVNPRGFLDAAKTVTRNEMAYGFALNSQVIQERNVENLLKATTMTNKAGQMFSGFAVTNPYDGTDTKFVVKEHGTGKDVGQFASMKDAVDNGFTVYDQKFVHGEQLIKNAKQQGRNLDLAATGHRLDNSYKVDRNKEQEIQTRIAAQTEGDKIRYEGFKADKEGTDATKSYHDSITAGLKTQEERSDLSKKQLEQRAGVLEATMSGGAIFNGKTKSSGTDENSQVYAATELRQAKKVNDLLFDMGVDKMLIPSISNDALKRAAPHIKDEGIYSDAIITAVAENVGMVPEKVKAYQDPAFRSLSYEDQDEFVRRAISDNQARAEEQKDKSFSEQGNKELSGIYRDISKEFEYLSNDRNRKQGMGYKAPMSDDFLMDQAISKYSEQLTDAQGKYYKGITASDFIKKIKAAVAEEQLKKEAYKSMNNQAAAEETKAKADREKMRSALSGRGGY